MTFGRSSAFVTTQDIDIQSVTVKISFWRMYLIGKTIASDKAGDDAGIRR